LRAAPTYHDEVHEEEDARSYAPNNKARVNDAEHITLIFHLLFFMIGT
jgi:hypothetical protein